MALLPSFSLNILPINGIKFAIKLTIEAPIKSPTAAVGRKNIPVTASIVAMVWRAVRKVSIFSDSLLLPLPLIFFLLNKVDNAPLNTEMIKIAIPTSIIGADDNVR